MFVEKETDKLSMSLVALFFSFFNKLLNVCLSVQELVRVVLSVGLFGEILKPTSPPFFVRLDST